MNIEKGNDNYDAYKQLGFEFFQKALEAAGADTDIRFQIMDKAIPVVSAFAEMMIMAYDDLEFMKETFPNFDSDEFIYLLGKLLLQEYIDIADLDFAESGDSLTKSIMNSLGFGYTDEDTLDDNFDLKIYTFDSEEEREKFLNTLSSGNATIDDLNNENLNKSFSKDELLDMAKNVPEGETFLSHLLKKAKQTEKADNEMIKGAIKHIVDIKKEQLKVSDGLDYKLDNLFGRDQYTEEQRELVDEVNEDIAESFLLNLFKDDDAE